MRSPEKIEFSKDETKAIAASIQRYFREELDQDLGQLPAEMLLDFMAEQVGPYFYNRGLRDAQTVLTQKAEDTADAIYALERRPASR
jgi:uncharacterized protein (DUF2164 family)